MDPLRLIVEQITAEGRRIVCEEPPEAFPVLKEMSRAGECVFTAPIGLRLQVARSHRVIDVSGSIDTRVRLVCSRCLNEFDFALSSRFSVVYIDESSRLQDKPAAVEEELSEEDLDSILFRGEVIDLRPAVQEQVVMAFPQRFLCRDACKGLCRHCGRDLNTGPCKCSTTSDDSPFAVLKEFKPPG